MSSLVELVADWRKRSMHVLSASKLPWNSRADTLDMCASELEAALVQQTERMECGHLRAELDTVNDESTCTPHANYSGDTITICTACERETALIALAIEMGFTFGCNAVGYVGQDVGDKPTPDDVRKRYEELRKESKQ